MTQPLGRSWEFRRQGVECEKVEGMLLNEIDSIFEDALVFLVIQKPLDPVKELQKFLTIYSRKSKMEPGPQPTPPEKGQDCIEPRLIMMLIDPLLQHLARTTIKLSPNPKKICGEMAKELDRLVEQAPEELRAICKGTLYEHATADHLQEDTEGEAKYHGTGLSS
mmetsp:Transcript_22270/g.50370  ORF Transcript_22270/g.50370 Transcript_22270/m.50370 type:complete len:165 (+) Transcript_22270:61-555(+)